MIRKTKIRIIASLLVVIAIGLGLFALRPVFFATTFFASRLSAKGHKTNTFDNVHVETYNKQNNKIDIVADQAVQNNNGYALKNMESVFVLPNGDKCKITADEANTIDKNTIDFKGNVHCELQSGLLATTEQATVNLNKRTAKGHSYIEAKQDIYLVSGKEFFIDFEKNQMKIEQNAKCSNDKESLESNALDVQLTTDNKLHQMHAIEKAKYSSSKYTVTAEQIHYLDGKVEIIGNAQIVEHAKKTKLFGQHIIAQLDANNSIQSANVAGSAKYVSDSIELRADNFNYNGDTLLAEHNVVLDYTASNRQKYNIRTQEMTAKMDKSMTISKIESNKKLTIKTNNDIVKADSGNMEGDKLFLHGNVFASTEFGNMTSNDAELNLVTGDINFKNSSGIIKDGAVGDAK